MRESDDYQQSSLGDLPYDMVVERGEHRQFKGAIDPNASLSTRNDAPAINGGVLPVYNTLPANGGRFSNGQTFLTGNLGSAGTFTATIFKYKVPAGKVFYADSFQVNVLDMYVFGTGIGLPTKPFNVSLYVNRACEVFNQNILVQSLDGYYPCSVIAGFNDEITIDVTMNKGPYGVPYVTQVEFITHLNGDMLTVNDMQTQYTALRPTLIHTKEV